MMHVKGRALRGVASVRADANDPKALLEELNRAFAQFKTEHTAEIAALRKDIVQTEKVDRINNSITELQTALDETNKKVAAATLGGGGSDKKAVSAEQRAYADGFERFFRKGADAGLHELAVKAALQTQSDPDGGFTVPTEMESTIDRVLSTVSAMRSLATIRQISTGMYKKLVTTSGAASGWVGETAARPETTNPKLSALEFPAMELYANPAATQTLLDDSAVNIEQWLADEVAIIFSEQEGAAFISGDGNNKPRGILQYPTVADASYAWGSIGFTVSGAAADFGANNPLDQVIKLCYSLKQGYRSNANWMMNRTIQEAIRKFKDSTGQYLWQPPVQAGQPQTILGYPVVDDDNMPNVGANAFPIAFGDFRRGYVIVDRVGIRVLRDPFTNKPYVMFYTTKRVGGGVQNFEAIKLFKCST